MPPINLPAKLSKGARLQLILDAVDAGEASTASGLARRCGVSVRTIFRDFDSLKRRGATLSFDADSQRYSLAQNQSNPLSSALLTAVIAGCQSLRESTTVLQVKERLRETLLELERLQSDDAPIVPQQVEHFLRTGELPPSDNSLESSECVASYRTTDRSESVSGPALVLSEVASAVAAP